MRSIFGFPSLGKFGRDFNVSVLVYSNPEDSQVLMALRERNPEVIIVKGGAVFVGVLMLRCDMKASGGSASLN
jgi:hypothetical protein